MDGKMQDLRKIKAVLHRNIEETTKERNKYFNNGYYRGYFAGHIDQAKEILTLVEHMIETKKGQIGDNKQ